MKGALKISVLLFLACCVFGSCAKKFKQVSISSVEVESVVPTSLHSASAILAVGINNPAPSFKLKDVEATVKRNGEVFGTVNADPLAIDGKTERIYHVPLQAQLADGIGVIQLISAYRNFKPEDFTVDVKARANVVGGVGKNIEYKDVPLSKLMKK